MSAGSAGRRSLGTSLMAPPRLRRSFATPVLVACIPLFGSTGCQQASSPRADLTPVDGVRLATRGRGEAREITAVWEQDEVERTVRARGEIQLSPSGTTLTGLGPGASLSVRETSWSGYRELNVTRDGFGRLDYAYATDGHPAAFDEEVEEWLGKVLAVVSRSTPIGAEPRARELLAQAGPEELLHAVRELEDPTAKTTYFTVLLAEPQLDRRLLLDAAESARTGLSRDQDLGAVLLQIAEHRPDDQALTLALVAGTEGMAGTAARGDVLAGIAQRRMVAATTASALIQSAQELSSSSVQSRVLMAILASGPSDSQVVGEYLEAAEALSAAENRSEAMRAVLQKEGVDARSLILVAESLEALSSPAERTLVLQELLSRAPPNPGLMSACLDVIAGLNSSASQEHTLSRLLAIPDLDRSTLEKAALVVDAIPSTSVRDRLREQIIQRLFALGDPQ